MENRSIQYVWRHLHWHVKDDRLYRAIQTRWIRQSCRWVMQTCWRFGGAQVCAPCFPSNMVITHEKWGAWAMGKNGHTPNFEQCGQAYMQEIEETEAQGNVDNVTVEALKLTPDAICGSSAAWSIIVKVRAAFQPCQRMGLLPMPSCDACPPMKPHAPTVELWREPCLARWAWFALAPSLMCPPPAWRLALGTCAMLGCPQTNIKVRGMSREWAIESLQTAFLLFPSEVASPMTCKYWTGSLAVFTKGSQGHHTQDLRSTLAKAPGWRISLLEGAPSAHVEPDRCGFGSLEPWRVCGWCESRRSHLQGFGYGRFLEPPTKPFVEPDSFRDAQSTITNVQPSCCCFKSFSEPSFRELLVQRLPRFLHDWSSLNGGPAAKEPDGEPCKVLEFGAQHRGGSQSWRNGEPCLCSVGDVGGDVACGCLMPVAERPTTRSRSLNSCLYSFVQFPNHALLFDRL